MSGTSSANAITLKGSTDIVAEYLNFALNSILYQRGVYPHEMFTKESKYGVPLLLTVDPTLKDYLSKITEQLKGAESF